MMPECANSLCREQEDLERRSDKRALRNGGIVFYRHGNMLDHSPSRDLEGGGGRKMLKQPANCQFAGKLSLSGAVRKSLALIPEN